MIYMGQIKFGVHDIQTAPEKVKIDVKVSIYLSVVKSLHTNRYKNSSIATVCDNMRTIVQVLGQIICKNSDKHDFEKTNRCTKNRMFTFSGFPSSNDIK